MSNSLIFKSQMAQLNTVLIEERNLEVLYEQLTEKLAKAPEGFFKGAAMVAHLKAVDNVDLSWLMHLKTVFQKHHLLLVGVMQHPFDSETLFRAGLIDVPFLEPKSAKLEGEEEIKSVDLNEEIESSSPHFLSGAAHRKTLTVRHHVRSGQRIYARGGDLVVIGTVNAGAEILADGNIHVLGTLRGKAFAGIKNNEDAHIFCLEMAAEIISIAGIYQNLEKNAHTTKNNCLITLNSDETMQITPL